MFNYLVLALLLALAATGEARHHGDVQHASHSSGDDAQWEDHVHSRVRRFRRKDSVDDCDPKHSCLLGRWCVESREARNMERDADGHCQCRADAHTCRIEGLRKLRFHEFECLDTSAAHVGMQRGANGDCGAAMLSYICGNVSFIDLFSVLP
jgi:hypothetical protein